MHMTSAEYLSRLERLRSESGGTRIPSLDQWGQLIKLAHAERVAKAKGVL